MVHVKSFKETIHIVTLKKKSNNGCFVCLEPALHLAVAFNKVKLLKPVSCFFIACCKSVVLVGGVRGFFGFFKTWIISVTLASG